MRRIGRRSEEVDLRRRAAIQAEVEVATTRPLRDDHVDRRTRELELHERARVPLVRADVAAERTFAGPNVVQRVPAAKLGDVLVGTVDCDERLLLLHDERGVKRRSRVDRPCRVGHEPSRQVAFGRRRRREPGDAEQLRADAEAERGCRCSKRQHAATERPHHWERS